MKELEIHTPDKLKVREERQVKKQHRYLGTKRLHRGHSLWEFNSKELTLKKAEFESTNIHFDIAAKENYRTSKKIVIKEGYFYVGALNRETAKKQFRKLLGLRVDLLVD